MLLKRILCAAVLLIAVPASAYAGSFFGGSASGQGCQVTGNGPDGGSADCGVSSASSEPGAMSVVATSSAVRGSDGRLVSTGSSQALASYLDVLHFGIGAGTFTIPLDFHGSILVINDQQGPTNASRGSVGGGMGVENTVAASLSLINPTGNPEGLVIVHTGTQSEVKDAVYSFTDGQLRLQGGLRADAACGDVGQNGSCTVDVNYGSSLRLLAGTLRDTTGAIRTDVAVTSDSGFDYLAGVPPHNPTNTPPVADAGNNQPLSVLSLVMLDGTQSMDPDGDPISFAWTLDAPAGSSAALDDATLVEPSFTADMYGDYVATLVVTDSNGAPSAPDSVTVGFANLPPVADAGLNQAAVVGDLIVLDGSASSDVNMDPLTYLWSFDSKPAASLAEIFGPTSEFPDFFVDEPGDYVVELVVNDGLLDSDPSTVLVTAITAEDATLLASVIDLVDVVNTIAPEDFENRNMRNALTNKLNAVLRMIDRGDYLEALDKLENDLRPKTDGCAAAGAPDSNDWILSCEEQDIVNLGIAATMELLERLIND